MRKKMIFLSYILFLSSGFLLVNIGLATSQNPKNTVVLVGTPVAYLNCSSSSTSTSLFVWYFLPVSGGQRQTIVVGCIPSVPQYNTDSPTQNSCNLQVLYATSDFAGLYTCSPGGETSVSAEFIVLETNAICSNTPDGSNQHKLTCGIGYAGNMQPKVTWFNGTNYEISSTPGSNASYVTASFSVSGSEVPLNICQANFTSPSNPPANFASNAPDFTSTCNVTSYNNENSTGCPAATGWIIGFSISCVLLIGVITAIIVYFKKRKDKLVCRKQRGCGIMECIGGILLLTSAAIIGATGTIVGGLLAGGVIHVGASSECCFGWIGGFTIVISLSVCGGIIYLCLALNCLKIISTSVAPEAYTNSPEVPRGKNSTMDYVSHRTS